MADLLDPDDPDWEAYRQNSPEYYLRVVGEAIKRYLGWHLAPSITETIKVQVRQRGLIPLPSRYVTDISYLQIGNNEIGEDDYTWNQGGWIQTSQYYYDTSRYPTSVSSWRPNEATVTLTHGYSDVPLEVKQLAYEIAEATAETPVGNVSQMSTPAGYRISLSAPSGVHFTDTQQQILAPYRLYGVA